MCYLLSKGGGEGSSSLCGFVCVSGGKVDNVDGSKVARLARLYVCSRPHNSDGTERGATN